MKPKPLGLLSTITIGFCARVAAQADHIVVDVNKSGSDATRTNWILVLLGAILATTAATALLQWLAFKRTHNLAAIKRHLPFAITLAAVLAIGGAVVIWSKRMADGAQGLLRIGSDLTLSFSKQQEVLEDINKEHEAYVDWLRKMGDTSLADTNRTDLSALSNQVSPYQDDLNGLEAEARARTVKEAEATKLAARAKAEASAVAFNQTAADRGDAYGQMRMGERYRDGDGVPKDETKARDFFAKSAAQGNQDAARALAKMHAADTTQP